MYVPKHFKVDDLDELAGYMQASRFATLVSTVDGVPFASHLPFCFDPDKGELGTLYAHVARANSHWKSFGSEADSLTIFNGPHAFVSANWMQAVNALPTWNYVAVHAYGRPQIINDADAVLQLLVNLNSANETEATGIWTTDKVEQTFLDKMLKGIVAFEIPLTRIEGKRKMGQNRTPEVQASSIQGLRQAGDPTSLATADEMEAGGDENS